MASVRVLHETHVMELPRKPWGSKPINGPAFLLTSGERAGRQLTLRDVHELNSQGVRQVIVYRNYIYRWGDLANQLRTLIQLALARLEGSVDEKELARCRTVAADALDRLTGDKVLGRLRACPELERELEGSLQPYCLGRLRAWTPSERWKDIRTDVLRLARQLAQVGPSGFQMDYLTLLRRWLKRFRHADPEPEEPPLGFDPNRLAFPLPPEVARNPLVLRDWIEAWRPFDCRLPETGSWEALGQNGHVAGDGAGEDDQTDLSDADDVFKASLRPWGDAATFDTDVDGDVAWNVLSDDVVSDDVTTPEQERTIAIREKRRNFGEASTMMARRKRLREYFGKKYFFPEEKLELFESWATIMEKNMQELEALCS